MTTDKAKVAGIAALIASGSVVVWGKDDQPDEDFYRWFNGLLQASDPGVLIVCLPDRPNIIRSISNYDPADVRGGMVLVAGDVGEDSYFPEPHASYSYIESLLHAAPVRLEHVGSDSICIGEAGPDPWDAPRSYRHQRSLRMKPRWKRRNSQRRGK